MLTDNSLSNMMIQSKSNNHLSIINNHFAFAPLHLSRTLYKSTLFMQNKPNFQKSQMNVNPYNTTDYENKWQRRVRKNKPNTNPIKPNLRKAKMSANVFITKDYRKKDDFAVRKNKPNSNPVLSAVEWANFRQEMPAG